MQRWKKNLVILSMGNFFAMAAMSSISPFLPLYIQELGITGERQVGIWTGVIFGANFLTAFLFSPIWGRLADKHGRKIMVVRSGIGMAVTITLMGFVTSPVQLLVLRMLNGCISGFIPASIALTSTITPKKEAGYALGTLHAIGVSGSICGPIFGGLMADSFGYGTIFSCTGLLLFAAAMLVIFFVREVFVPQPNEDNSGFLGDFKKIWTCKPIPSLFLAVTLVQLAILGTLPHMSVFVQKLAPSSANLALLSGMTIAATAVSNMLASPWLGKLGDKYGSQKVLLYAVTAGAVFMIPQAFVAELWQLVICRFLLGMCLGGMLPSINALIRRSAPAGMESRTYGYSTSAMYLGNIAGPNITGALSASFGIRSIFIWAGILLLVNLVWIRTMIVSSCAKGSYNRFGYRAQK